jgi:hypothetical protein
MHYLYFIIIVWKRLDTDNISLFVITVSCTQYLQVHALHLFNGHVAFVACDKSRLVGAFAARDKREAPVTWQGNQEHRSGLLKKFKIVWLRVRLGVMRLRATQISIFGIKYPFWDTPSHTYMYYTNNNKNIYYLVFQ